MSTEVTPESLRTHADWMHEHHGEVEASFVRRWAEDLERQQRPLPTEPGWYATIVVERGGESCTGALLSKDGLWWCTAEFVDGNFLHRNSDMTTIRWAEQDGKTPGQTLWEAGVGKSAWSTLTPLMKDRQEYAAAAVLAAHGTPTLTPVGEHPEPGTRGLLPVAVNGSEWRICDVLAMSRYYICGVDSDVASAILADPRPDGAA